MHLLTARLLEQRLRELQGSCLQHLRACQLCFSISDQSEAHRLARLDLATPLMTP